MSMPAQDPGGPTASFGHDGAAPYGAEGVGFVDAGGYGGGYAGGQTGGLADGYGVGGEAGGGAGPVDGGAYGAVPPEVLGGGFPANDLERVIAACVGRPEATPRLLQALSAAQVWIPLPSGGGPDSTDLDLPTVELDGVTYVPVFSSPEQFRSVVGPMACAAAPMHEFARGLPPQLGVAVNPNGAVTVPVPPAAVPELCRAPAQSRAAGAGPAGHDEAAARTGARVRLWEPDPAVEPVDFLATAAGEFAVTPVVLTARRALGSVEGQPFALFVGVELDRWQEEDRAAAVQALGRALGVVPLPWPVNCVLLDVAQDPVGDWMLERVAPFYARE